MPDFLLRAFVKKHENVDDPAVRARYGVVAGVMGIMTNIILFILKITVGILSKSVAITADAVNNLSDSASSVITLVGFKMSQKPADDEHPYGHARMEYLSGLFVSLIVIFIGFEFFTESVNAILNPVKNGFDIFTVAVLVFSIFLKLWQGYFNRSVGKKINSVALIATSFDSVGDAIATSVVLFGIIISLSFGIVLDGWFGLAVAIFIIISGVRLMKEAIDPILGIAPDNKLVENIASKIMSYEGVLGYHDLVVHNYGEGRCFASVHVEVPSNQDIMLSHDIIDNIEFDFKKNDDLNVVIHLDPIETDNPLTNELREKVKSLLCEISDQISMHDFRLVSGTTHSNLLFDICIPASFAINDIELRELVTHKIKEIDPSYNTILTIDRNYTSTCK
ncbi:MAG: cation transporter [Ruminococcaceae bacterium]|nr:cation transporter [Oscillospiraceae bacterium]